MTKISGRDFGRTKTGERVFCWSLVNGRGMTAEILTFGGILRALRVPVRGGLRDVALGFDEVAGYEKQDWYVGAIVGRVANRIGGAGFTLDGREVSVSANAGKNCLHGGFHGFHEKIWDAEAQGEKLALSCVSPDGEEGFPGTVTVRVVYALSDDGALTMDYFAVTDAPTLVNLTNHSYFNLKGQGAGTVEDHRVRIHADYFCENAPDGVPTGVLLSVEGTPFDLREGRLLGPGLGSDHPQMVAGAGYDHNFVLKSGMDGALLPAAEAEADGLRLECLTTQPGVQLYTANYLTGAVGKGGAAYSRRGALCLETQNWPDAVNHPDFPSSVLRPGQTYRQTTVYRFSEV